MSGTIRFERKGDVNTKGCIISIPEIYPRDFRRLQRRSLASTIETEFHREARTDNIQCLVPFRGSRSNFFPQFRDRIKRRYSKHAALLSIPSHSSSSTTERDIWQKRHRVAKERNRTGCAAKNPRSNANPRAQVTRIRSIIRIPHE